MGEIPVREARGLQPLHRQRSQNGVMLPGTNNKVNISEMGVNLIWAYHDGICTGILLYDHILCLYITIPQVCKY